MEQVESEQAQQEMRKSPYLQGPNQMEKVNEMPAQVEQTLESHMVTENDGEPDQPHILATEQNVVDQQ